MTSRFLGNDLLFKINTQVNLLYIYFREYIYMFDIIVQ